MKIFYDERYRSYDTPVDGTLGNYYTYYTGSDCWDTIESFDEIGIGTRQVPDTVLRLIGAPELEINV
jgi:hypothetical protein